MYVVKTVRSLAAYRTNDKKSKNTRSLQKTHSKGILSFEQQQLNKSNNKQGEIEERRAWVVVGWTKEKLLLIKTLPLAKGKAKTCRSYDIESQ